MSTPAEFDDLKKHIPGAVEDSMKKRSKALNTEFDKELQTLDYVFVDQSTGETFKVNGFLSDETTMAIKKAFDKYVLPEKRVNSNKNGYSAASLTHGYKNTTVDTFNDGFNASTEIARQSLWGPK